MALERDEVVLAAVRILDQYGLADLSMRRLADSLGVKAGALYWHVANKQTLLAAVADEILAEVGVVAGDGSAALAAWAHRLRAVLLAHRDSAELIATALASGLCRSDPLAPVRSLLVGLGRGPREAGWGSAALLHLVLGHVAEEQNAQLFSQLGVSGAASLDEQGLDEEGFARGLDEEGFAHGVDALVSGLTAPSGPHPEQ